MGKTREQRRREKYDSTRGLVLSLAGFAAGMVFAWMALLQAFAASAW